jgi:uncharacterized protein with HEPN domain
MSKRVPSIVINDILSCIDHVTTYTAALSFGDFASNFMVVEACLYNIQIIGGAVAQLPNRLIHEYFGTDLPVVWNVIKNDLPLFKSELNVIHKNLLESGQ